MSKKTLNVTSIANELQGASLYFTANPPDSPQPESPTIISEPLPTPDPVLAKDIHDEPKVQDENHKKQTKPASSVASTRASMLAYKPVNKTQEPSNDLIETIRKTVKQVGKESLFIRATPEEKQRLASIVYAFNDMYRGESRRTSENEIGRIAVNWLLEDYQTNGKTSILAQVLAALNA